MNYMMPTAWQAGQRAIGEQPGFLSMQGEGRVNRRQIFLNMGGVVPHRPDDCKQVLS